MTDDEIVVASRGRTVLGRPGHLPPSASGLRADGLYSPCRESQRRPSPIRGSFRFHCFVSLSLIASLSPQHCHWKLLRQNYIPSPLCSMSLATRPVHPV